MLDGNPFDGVPCRDCGVAALRLEWRLTADPGPAALAGVQDKVTATSWPWCLCDSCGAECRGKLTD